MNAIQTLIEQFIANPFNMIIIILNIILIEVSLSLDNAACIATMVKDLDKEDQGKALKYGIIGAYVFRGLALIFTNVIIFSHRK